MHTPWQVDGLYFASIFNLALLLLVRVRIRVDVAKPFMLGLLLAALWAGCYGVDLTVPDLATKVWLLRARFLFLPFIGMVWFEMAHRLALGRKFLYGRRLALAAVVPVITVLLVWLPLPHGFEPMLPATFRVELRQGLYLLHFSLGPWAAVMFAHILGFLAVALWILWRTRLDTPWERGAHLVIIAAGLFGVSANALFLVRLLPPSGLNYGPILSPVSTGLAALALLRGRFFTLAPVARATMIENLEERLVVLDAAGRVVDLNRAAASALGTVAEKATGQKAEAVLAAWPEVVAHLRTENGDRVEMRIGADIYEMRSLPVGDQRGKLHARILQLRDVTQRRRDEEELRRAKEAAEAAGDARNRFLATMSHEIRTPLNQVLGYAQLLQGTSLSAEQREHLGEIVQGGGSLLRIIEGVLEYVQITSGGFTLKETPCAPRDLATHVCEPLLPRARGKGIFLRWKVGEDVPETILADPSRVSRVIFILVDNAIKFTERGGVEVKISRAEQVSAVASDRYLEIVVCDTGIGIAAEAMERIFEPFVQGDDSLTRRHGGVGLGLPIARKLCELAGGGLSVVSEPERGATFTARVAIRSSA